MTLKFIMVKNKKHKVTEYWSINPLLQSPFFLEKLR